MDAKDTLIKVAEAFHFANLDAVMIGNAATALQGVPVTTMDIDFCIPSHSKSKLETVAKKLDAELEFVDPYFRTTLKESEIEVKFFYEIRGTSKVISYDELFRNSDQVNFDGIYDFSIASLTDLFKNKKATGRQIDLAYLPIMEKTLKEKMRYKDMGKPVKKNILNEDIKTPADLEKTMIKKWLALPMKKRTHFLRVRLPNGGSCL